MKAPYIVVIMGRAFNVEAESVEEIRAEFGPDCTIYQEVQE